MKETKLLNCPFCGGKARLESDAIGKEKYLYSVSCADECVTQNRYYDTEEEAITAWNTRKPMERILERLETEDMALFNAINKYQKKMYTDGDALDKVRMLQHKQLSNHKAIEIVKEEGGIE